MRSGWSKQGEGLWHRRNPPAPSRPAAILALSIGNAVELYDFTIYSFFALTIGKLFFPVQSEFGPLLLALLTFGIGFVVRPLGGLLSDRLDRRRPFVVWTALASALPTYPAFWVLCHVASVPAALAAVGHVTACALATVCGASRMCEAQRSRQSSVNLLEIGTLGRRGKGIP